MRYNIIKSKKRSLKQQTSFLKGLHNIVYLNVRNFLLRLNLLFHYITTNSIHYNIMTAKTINKSKDNENLYRSV